MAIEGEQPQVNPVAEEAGDDSQGDGAIAADTRGMAWCCRLFRPAQPFAGLSRAHLRGSAASGVIDRAKTERQARRHTRQRGPPMPLNGQLSPRDASTVVPFLVPAYGLPHWTEPR